MKPAMKRSLAQIIHHNIAIYLIVATNTKCRKIKSKLKTTLCIFKVLKT